MSAEGCGGLGFYECLCGGDQCICLQGTIDCDGCEDCESPVDGLEDDDER